MPSPSESSVAEPDRLRADEVDEAADCHRRRPVSLAWMQVDWHWNKATETSDGAS